MRGAARNAAVRGNALTPLWRAWLKFKPLVQVQPWLATRPAGLWVLLGACGYLAANLYAGPGTPFLLGGDQMFFWLDGMRLLSGQHIYQDFLQFTPPGTDLVYWTLFELFGPRIWVTNLVVLLLGMMLCGLSFSLAKWIMPPGRAALAAALVLVVYVKWLDTTHHWFSAAAVLCAVAVLMPSNTALRTAAAGGLLGVATFFTQTRGPAAALALCAALLWERSLTSQPWSEHLKRQLLLFGTLALTWLTLSSYYLVTLGAHQLWSYQVDFVHQYMLGSKTLADHSSAWQQLSGHILAMLVMYALPLICATALWIICMRETQAPPGERSGVLLLGAAGGGMLLEMLFSPNVLRASCVAAPSIILLVWLLGRHSAGVLRAAPAVLWLGVLAIAGHHTVSRHLQQSVLMQLPAGRAAVRPLLAEKLTWLAAHTHPEESFFGAAWLGGYLPLALRNPVFLDDVGGYMFRDDETPGAPKLSPAAEARLRSYVQHCAEQLLRKHVRYVLWQPRLGVPPFRVPVLQAFLQEHYTRAWTFSDRDEVWELKAPAGPSQTREP